MQKIKKLESLTSLRFFAAAMIVLGHGHGLFGSAGIATTLSLAQGVSFFFVLSGFILTYNYPTISTFDGVKKFYRARFARIFPSHIVAIIVLLFFTGGLNTGGLQGAKVLFAGLANVFLFQSVIPVKDVFLTFNGVSWSISTEMFFYLAFPLLIGSLIPGKWIKLLLLSVAVLFHLWFGMLWNVSYDEGGSQFSLMGLLYINPWVRILEFYIGVLTCQLFLKTSDALSVKKIPCAAFTFLEVCVIALSIYTMWISPRIALLLEIPGQAGIVTNYYLTKSGSALSFALLILIFAHGKGLVNKFLSSKWLVLLGEISFALYLVHMSVLVWFQKNLVVFSNLPTMIQAITFWSISLVVAWFLHRLIELPCRNLIIGWSKNRTFDKAVFDKSFILNAFFMVCVLVSIKIIAPS